MSHPTVAKCQIEVAFETQHTHFRSHGYGAYGDDPQRGSKEDLIIIVNNTKTHRPTIILGKYARDCKST